MANCVKSRVRLYRGEVMLFKGEYNIYDTVLTDSIVLKQSIAVNTLRLKKVTKFIHPRIHLLSCKWSFILFILFSTLIQLIYKVQSEFYRGPEQSHHIIFSSLHARFSKSYTQFSKCANKRVKCAHKILKSCTQRTQNEGTLSRSHVLFIMCAHLVKLVHEILKSHTQYTHCPEFHKTRRTGRNNFNMIYLLSFHVIVDNSIIMFYFSSVGMHNGDILSTLASQGIVISQSTQF